VVARGQPPRIAQQRPTSHIPTTTILFTCQRAYPSPAGPETRLGSLPRVARLSTGKNPNLGCGRSGTAPPIQACQRSRLVEPSPVRGHAQRQPVATAGQ
jgi:hypothetical protein